MQLDDDTWELFNFARLFGVCGQPEVIHKSIFSQHAGSNKTGGRENKKKNGKKNARVKQNQSVYMENIGKRDLKHD